MTGKRKNVSSGTDRSDSDAGDQYGIRMQTAEKGRNDT